MIRVHQLTKRYPRTLAVDRISFEVDKGQIVGFLGPNGAGKTTTMRVLTGFLPPTEGTVEVAGVNVVDKPLEVKRNVGYLPETPPLYPEMDVVEYLTFVGRIKGVSNADLPARLQYSIERCALDSVRHKLISQLSKGFRQRVGLAQAIIHNPAVLILDEPTAGLDPKQIIETRSLIKQLAGDHTIILSTHILPEVEQTCEKVIIINKGRIVATDSVENLTNRLRGSEAVAVEVASANGALDPAAVQGVLAGLPGVARVTVTKPGASAMRLEVESLAGDSARPRIARAIVEAGWNLTELTPVSLSLEEVFLELTKAEGTQA